MLLGEIASSALTCWFVFFPCTEGFPPLSSQSTCDSLPDRSSRTQFKEQIFPSVCHSSPPRFTHHLPCVPLPSWFFLRLCSRSHCSWVLIRVHHSTPARYLVVRSREAPWSGFWFLLDQLTGPASSSHFAPENSSRFSPLPVFRSLTCAPGFPGLHLTRARGSCMFLVRLPRCWWFFLSRAESFGLILDSIGPWAGLGFSYAVISSASMSCS
jgi:hypothetical protein